MKGFICFTDICIYKQFSCHEFIEKSMYATNIDKMNNLILFDKTIKTRCHMIRLILSPFLVTN